MYDSLVISLTNNIHINGTGGLKVHKIENFFDSDFGICIISLLGMSKY